jgi:hypothetical protein
MIDLFSIGKNISGQFCILSATNGVAQSSIVPFGGVPTMNGYGPFDGQNKRDGSHPWLLIVSAPYRRSYWREPIRLRWQCGNEFSSRIATRVRSVSACFAPQSAIAILFTVVS